MIAILEEAVKNYLQSIEVEFDKCSGGSHQGLVSKIIISGDKNLDVFVMSPVSKLSHIAELWFGDKDDYDKQDLTNEIANLIVGNAKIIATSKGVNFDISTPEFLGEKSDIAYDDVLEFKFKDECFYVMFKEQ